jgi:hypothetical protein
VDRLRGRLPRGRPPVVESSLASRRRLALNASASRDLMLLRECILLSLPSGFPAILTHLLSQDNRRE